MKRISVIIPTYNSNKTLYECVVSMLAQTTKVTEVIVVDNASTDDTKQVITTLSIKDSRVKYFRNTKNRGVTGGRNRGIGELSGMSDYILFFDHDMVAEKRMVEKLVDVAESADNIGIVTPKIFYFNDKTRIWSAGTGINLWTGQVLFRGGKDHGQYEMTQEVQVAPAAMLVKRGVFKKVRKFDERYFATFEDTDFCFRAKVAGYKTFYAHKALAWHKISPNPRDETERLLSRAYWVGRNRVLFMKDFGKLTFWFFIPIYALYFMRLSIKSNSIGHFFQYLSGLRDSIIKP